MCNIFCHWLFIPIKLHFGETLLSDAFSRAESADALQKVAYTVYKESLSVLIDLNRFLGLVCQNV